MSCVGADKTMPGGRDPHLWAELVRENWRRIGELRQDKADNRVLWDLLRDTARRNQKKRT
jgi:hypothetical protein